MRKVCWRDSMQQRRAGVPIEQLCLLFACQGRSPEVARVRVVKQVVVQLCQIRAVAACGYGGQLVLGTAILKQPLATLGSAGLHLQETSFQLAQLPAITLTKRQPHWHAMGPRRKNIHGVQKQTCNDWAV